MAHSYTVQFWAPAYASSFTSFYPNCTTSVNLGTVKSASASGLCYTAVIELSDQQYIQLTSSFTVTFSFSKSQLNTVSSTTRGTLTRASTPTDTELEVYVPKTSSGGTTGIVYKAQAQIRYYESNKTNATTTQNLGYFDMANDTTGSFTASGVLKTMSVSAGTLVGYTTTKGSTVVQYNVGDTISQTLSKSQTYIDVYAVVRYSISGEAYFYYNDGTNNYDTKANYNSSSPSTSGTVYVAAPDGPSRSGYQFMGWNTKSDGSGTTYGPGQGIGITATTSGYTTNFYAQWQKLYRVVAVVEFDSGIITAASNMPTTVSNDAQYTSATGNVSITIPSNVPVDPNNHYQFQYWQRGTYVYNPGQTYTFLGSDNYEEYTLTAIWKQVAWTVYGTGYFYNDQTDINNGSPLETVVKTDTQFSTSSGVIDITAAEVAAINNRVIPPSNQYRLKSWLRYGTNPAQYHSPNSSIPLPVAENGRWTSYIANFEQYLWNIGFNANLYLDNTTYYVTFTAKEDNATSSSKTLYTSQKLPQLFDSSDGKSYFNGWIDTSTGKNLGWGGTYSNTATIPYAEYKLVALWLPYYSIGFNIEYQYSASNSIQPALNTITLPEDYKYYNTKSKSETNQITVTLGEASTTDSRFRFSHWVDDNGTIYYANRAYTFTATTENLTKNLSAVWQQKVYCTIEFRDTVSNHGTQTNWPADMSLTEWSYGTTFTRTGLVLPVTTPTSTNYNFVGWGESGSSNRYTGTITIDVTYTVTGNVQYVYAYWEEKTYGPYYLTFSHPGFALFTNTYSITSTQVSTNNGINLNSYTTTTTNNNGHAVMITGLGYTSFSTSTKLIIRIAFSQKNTNLAKASYVTYIGTGSNYLTNNTSSTYIEFQISIAQFEAISAYTVQSIYWYPIYKMGIIFRDYYGNSLAGGSEEETRLPTGYGGTQRTAPAAGYFPVDTSSGTIQAIYTAPSQISAVSESFQFHGWATEKEVNPEMGKEIWSTGSTKTLPISLDELLSITTYRSNTYYEAGYIQRTYWVQIVYNRNGGTWTNSSYYTDTAIFSTKSYSIHSAEVPIKLYPAAAGPQWANTDRSFYHWSGQDGTDEIILEAGAEFTWTSTSESRTNPTVLSLTAVWAYNYYGEIIFMSQRTLSDGTVSLNKLYLKFNDDNPLQSLSENGYVYDKITKTYAEQYQLSVADAPQYKFVGWHKDSLANNYTYTTKGDSYPITFTFGRDRTQNVFILWAAFRQLHQYKATVSFDLNGGTGTFNDCVSDLLYWDQVEDDQPSSIKIDIHTTSYYNPKKNGYHCLDWTNEKNNKDTRINNLPFIYIPIDHTLGDDQLEIKKILYAYYEPITWKLNIVYNANTNSNTGAIINSTMPSNQSFSYTYDNSSSSDGINNNNGLQSDGKSYKFKVTIPDIEPKCASEDWYFLEWNTSAVDDSGDTYLPGETYEIQGDDTLDDTDGNKQTLNLYVYWVEGTLIWIWTGNKWEKAVPWIWNGTTWQKSLSKVFETYNGQLTWR